MKKNREIEDDVKEFIAMIVKLINGSTFSVKNKLRIANNIFVSFLVCYTDGKYDESMFEAMKVDLKKNRLYYKKMVKKKEKENVDT